MSQNIITGREESQEFSTTTGPLPKSAGKNSEVYLYDFAKMGGAVGDIFLRGHSLPKGAVVTNSYMDVLTAITSGTSTATVAVAVEGAGDVQAATLVSAAPWSTTGLKDTTNPEPGVETGYIKTTTHRHPKVTVAVEALTAGKFYVVLEYDVTG